MKDKTRLLPVKVRYVLLLMLLSALAFNSTYSSGQTLYVDAVKGKTKASGAVTDPLLSLAEAVLKTNSFKGTEPVTIKLYPGLYLVNQKLTLKTAASAGGRQPYTIEAVMLPDDKNWLPASMPVILSVSGNNATYEFAHCEGMLVAQSKVTIKGLKFVGNPNPGVHYYYPVRREDKNLSGLNVSQCLFIGEANSSAIQSAFWAAGQDIRVDHCIFHNSKIAFVLSGNISGFSLTHSIIDGAYNTAIWYGFDKTQPAFTVSNNIITNCYYVMVYPVENGQPAYTFRNCYITDNKNYLGNYPKAQDRFFAEKNRHIKEVNVNKTGLIQYATVKDDGITRDNLNLTKYSAARTTGAGLFMR